MSTWILQGQLSEKTFQGLLGDPNQDRFGKLKATWAAAGVTLVDAYMNPCGYFFAFLDGSSENVHACVMMFRALGVWSDTKLDVVNHFRDLNKFFQKSSEIVSYYDAPWAELDKQKRLAEEAKDEIRSSIRYASQIQQAMLPSSFPSDLEIGVHWQPLNVVGGDLYLVRDLGDQLLLAVIDCSGHGVPGSLLAVLTNSIFEQAIVDQNIQEPGDYLTAAHQQILRLLNKQDAKQVEGFDGTVCIYHRKEQRLSVAGARNNLLVIEQDGSVTEIVVTRKSVGSTRLAEDFQFPTEQLEMAGRTFVMMTDGITDIMGGTSQKTLFGKVRLKAELTRSASQPVSQIISRVILTLKNYQGQEPTRDDQAMMIFRKA